MNLFELDLVSINTDALVLQTDRSGRNLHAFNLPSCGSLKKVFTCLDSVQQRTSTELNDLPAVSVARAIFHNNIKLISQAKMVWKFGNILAKSKLYVEQERTR